MSLTPLQGSFPGLQVGLQQGSPQIGWVFLARPDKANALSEDMWHAIGKAIHALEAEETVCAIIITGQGAHFTAGIDKSYLRDMMSRLSPYNCPARAREAFRANLLKMQDAFSAMERCKWPVIAAINGPCVGGGIDLATACDIRICSQSATFCVKEIDLAITADAGTLQRLPHIIGHGAALDVSLTGRTFSSDEALRLGLVSQVVPGDALLAAALKLAQAVSSKSPLALIGTKRMLLHTRDHPAVGPGLEHVANYNAAMIMSEDLNALVAAQGKPVRFSKL